MEPPSFIWLSVLKGRFLEDPTFHKNQIEWKLKVTIRKTSSALLQISLSIAQPKFFLVQGRIFYYILMNYYLTWLTLKIWLKSDKIEDIKNSPKD